MYQLLKTQMEEDGFFDLTGITEMMQQMIQEAGGSEAGGTKILPKVPQDHLRKSIAEDHITEDVTVDEAAKAVGIDEGL